MRTIDMTHGNPLGLILAFAVPLLIGNIFQQIYNMVDTMVVGHHLGDGAIAAIGATSTLYSLIINFACGLNNGYSIVLTQRFGAHSEKEVKQAIAGMLLLDLGVSALLTVLSLAFLGPLMGFMNTPEAIVEAAGRYIRIICGGIVFTVAYNMFAAILRSVGNSRSPLYFLILSSLLNIGLDLLFVMGLELGVAGAALATVLSQAAAAVGCGVYVLRSYRPLLPERADFRVSGAILRDLISNGFAMALMNSLVDFGSVIFQRASNLLGQVCITAYAASRKLVIVLLQPLGTLAYANSTFVGQNWGARQTERIRSTLKKVLLLEIGWGLLSLAAIWLFGEPLIRLTTGTEDPSVVASAVLSLRIHFSMFPVLGILFCLRNALQAMGQKLAPVASSCIELGMKFLSARLLIPRLGFLGTCVTEPVTWVLMACFLAAVYLSKRKTLFPEASGT